MSKAINNRMRYTRQAIVTNTFYQMPRFLTADEFSGSNLSNNARLLYTLLLDRHRISVKNGWFDDNGEVYIYFKREEMENQIGLSKVTIIKVMQELKDFFLVEEKKQGLNKPNKIYLLSPIVGNNESPDQYLDPTTDYNPEDDYTTGDLDTEHPNVQELNPRTFRNHTFGSTETIPPKVQNLYPNNNKLIKNQKKNNNMSNNEGSKTATASKTARGEPPAAAEPPNTIPYSQILEMYNELCETKGLRSIRNISGKRKTQTAARFKEYGIDGFTDLFEKVSTSLFLCGGGERGWKADFDWLIAPTNMQKVLEGKYDDDQSNTPLHLSAKGQPFLYAPTSNGVIEMPFNPAYDEQNIATMRHIVSNPYENYRNKNGFNTMATLQQMLDAEAAIEGQINREGVPK